MTPQEAEKLLDRLNDQEKQNVKNEQARAPERRRDAGEGLVIRPLLAVALLAASPAGAADDVRVSAIGHAAGADLGNDAGSGW